MIVLECFCVAQMALERERQSEREPMALERERESWREIPCRREGWKALRYHRSQ